MNKMDAILKLLHAGYSKTEIDELTADYDQIQIIPPEDEEVEKEEEVPEFLQKAIKEEPETTAKLEESIKKIEQTLAAIQANNIKNSSLPDVKEKTEFDIVNEILGGIKTNGNE